MQGSRLPKAITPSLYKVRSAPDLERLTFAGTTSIECDCVEETDLIAVNCNNLDIKSVAVVQPGDDAVIKISKHEVDEARQLLLITLSQSLVPGGKIKVTMEYTGTLNDRMQGFYRVDDKARTGNFGAACHFEATGAREAFPCFDEPLFRARFLIAVDIDKEHEARLTVLSNMPEARRESLGDGGKVRVHFEETPKLPTYLVSWCVGFDYESVATESKGGIPVRVHVPKGKAKHAGLALEVASNALDIYADFFRVDYPLPKMVNQHGSAFMSSTSFPNSKMYCLSGPHLLCGLRHRCDGELGPPHLPRAFPHVRRGPEFCRREAGRGDRCRSRGRSSV